MAFFQKYTVQIIKLMFSASIIQLMLISFYIIPPKDLTLTFSRLGQYQNLSEMICSAALTAILPLWIIVILKLKNKFSK